VHKFLEGSTTGGLVGLIFIFLSTVGFLVGTMPPLRAEVQVPACYKVPMPGPENTLNPNAPKDKQVQDTTEVCDIVTFPDNPAHVGDLSPVTDYHHDPRAFA
jgi:hypothetical protein